MRKEYRKALLDAFGKAMGGHLPEYTAAKPDRRLMQPGERAWSRKILDNLYLWIVLQPSPKDYEWFTIEIGWSPDAGFPALTARPMLPQTAEDLFSLPACLIRLSSLYSDFDPWFEIEPVPDFDNQSDLLAHLMAMSQPMDPARAMDATGPVVQEAMDRLQSHGLPWLESATRHILKNK